jgi:aldose 1-epimerase
MNQSYPSSFERLKKEKFQQTIDGKKTDLYFLKNHKIELAITNYGARIVSFLVPDQEGRIRDIVVGFDDLDKYIQAEERYYGAIVGRYANRIAKGKFVLDNRGYVLATNNGANHLHGGAKGFQDVVWNVAKTSNETLTLKYLSKDGEEGYPGNLDAMVQYTLKGNDLEIYFSASTDKNTVFNITNHSFFNLNGQGSGSILDHQLMINADHYTPIDETSIPLGEIAPVANTPFDFRKIATIGSRINQKDQQLKHGSGYDHNYVLNKKDNHSMKLAAKAIGDKSGIVLEVLTTEPGMQFYSGNFMKGRHTIKYGFKDEIQTAFCLETQHYPDSPNHPQFPSTVLKPGELFNSRTIFSISTLKA